MAQEIQRQLEEIEVKQKELGIQGSERGENVTEQKSKIKNREYKIKTELRIFAIPIFKTKIMAVVFPKHFLSLESIFKKGIKIYPFRFGW